MRSYIIILLTSILLIFLYNFYLVPTSINGVKLLEYIFVSIAICATGISAISLLVRLIPKNFFSYKQVYFKTFNFEKNFYNWIRIKEWKEKIPELGNTAGFPKNKVKCPRNQEYLKRFLAENCIAEFIHFYAICFGSFVFTYLPTNLDLTIGLPIFLVNFYLNILPLFVQRYLRPKLIRLYEKSQTLILDEVYN